jgi:hypothetical protein
MSEVQFVFKPYNTTELAELYGVSYKTFTAWLKPIRDKLGPKLGKVWTIAQVKIIVEHLGTP